MVLAARLVTITPGFALAVSAKKVIDIKLTSITD